MQRLKNSSFKELVNANSEEKRLEHKDIAKMQGVHNYDILSNEIYAQRYLYTPVRFPNRYRYVISKYGYKELRKSALDLVRIVCDLPYL